MKDLNLNIIRQMKMKGEDDIYVIPDHLLNDSYYIHKYILGEMGTVYLEGKEIPTNKNEQGLIYVKLWTYPKNKFSKPKLKNFKVNELVSKLYLENPNNYKYVKHIDNNRYNNHWSNLQWIPFHYYFGDYRDPYKFKSTYEIKLFGIKFLIIKLKKDD